MKPWMMSIQERLKLLEKLNLMRSDKRCPEQSNQMKGGKECTAE